MNKYPLTHTNKSQEKAIINEILVNNNYPQQSKTKAPQNLGLNKKENGLLSHTLDQKLEQLSNSLKIPMWEYHLEQRIISNTT
jgi:hypothetical protein